MSMENPSLVEQFAAYTDWRTQLATGLRRLRNWLSDNDLGDALTDQRMAGMLDRLADDRLTVAFVAEFSRGKSELINAIFFGEYGDRILPSSAGRTTMCPTELLYDDTKPPLIELLPIETRATHGSILELKRHPEEWTAIELDTRSAEAMQVALKRVGEAKRVSTSEAHKLGFAIDVTGDGEGGALQPDENDTVEVPCWRHAVINFPHPLLEKGLVILDTPGLNAIGAEPELTLSLLPNAHAVLFILAADTGVTQSDLAVWRHHVGGHTHQKGRLVVLNKIDGLWDGLRSDADIESEIERQVHSVAHTLALDPQHVYPVSAQKGLVAKVSKDDGLLARSRITELETALAAELLPSRHAIVADNTRAEALDVLSRTQELLNARRAGLRTQLQELTDLRGKNHSVVDYIVRKVKQEKDEFDQSLQRFYAVRSVFSQLTNRLFANMGLDAVRDETRRTRESMLEARFSAQLRNGMSGFFEELRHKLIVSAKDIDEITKMMTAMYRRFGEEHGERISAPQAFSLARYSKELNRLEASCNAQYNTVISLLTMEKKALTQRFFETVAVQARRVFEAANRDVEQWLRAVMAPLEARVREHKVQVKRRLESMKRVHEAADTLEERIAELQLTDSSLATQLAQLDAIKHIVVEALAPHGALARAA